MNECQAVEQILAYALAFFMLGGGVAMIGGGLALLAIARDVFKSGR